MRLDKLLSELNYGTRSEIKKDLKNGLVQVNGDVIKRPERKVSPETDEIFYMGKKVEYYEFEYFLLNKPQGYVCAVRDSVYPTVLELIDHAVRKDLAPVGRLDVDTEGLLLVTNDGQLSHQLLSPKKHVDKVYYAEINGIVSEEDLLHFKEGLDIGEKNLTLPANLKILSVDEKEGKSRVHVTLHEGKFHQVKRMFQAVGKEVEYLKRISMGSLSLPQDLKPGEYLRITKENVLKGLKK